MMRHLTTVLFLLAALLLSMVPGNAATPIFHGVASKNRASVCNLSLDFGAFGDDSHDDSAALNAAISAWQAGNCNTIVLDAGKTYLINSAIQPTCTTHTDGGGQSAPIMPPLRFTSDGPAWSGVNFSDYPPNGTGALDLRYNGQDGLHPAKFDLRCSGFVEIDHLTIEDLGTDDFLFGQTTNATLSIHDDIIIGDPSKSGTSAGQDFFRMGSTGYWANNVTTTNGSTTLTINTGSGDAPFTAGMVTWPIYYGSTAQFTSNTLGLTHSNICAVVSSTQVTLCAAATATISGGVANYFAGDGHIGTDINGPFQGYISKFEHNLYYHIRRGIIWGNYANSVVVRDEYYTRSSGCSGITACAPYYFDKAGVQRNGNIISGSAIEMVNYPYAVSLQNFAIQNDFDDLTATDSNFVDVGGAYIGNFVYGNRFSLASYGNSIPFGSGNITTVAAPISSGTQTVTPASMTGIVASNKVLIDPDSTTNAQEYVTVSSTTSTTFTATFVNSHPANIRVATYTPFFSGPGYTQDNILITNGNSSDGSIHPYSQTFGGTNKNKVQFNGPLILPNSGSSFTVNSLSVPQLSDFGTVAQNNSNVTISAFGNRGTLLPNWLSCYGSDFNGTGTTCIGPTSSAGYNGILGKAFSVWNIGVGSLMTVDTSGNVGFNGGGNFGSSVNVNAGNIQLAGGISQYLKLTDASGTPNKFVRASGGSFQVYDSAFGTDLLDVANGGTITTAGKIVAPSGAAASCTGGFTFATSGVMVISGAGVPTCTAPAGSMYLRTDGASGSRLYISAGSGTWAAVAGV